ncbi:hypothetical protein, putative [Plasmodium sp.]|nr:hypothetical protein, putative [Plasmodium sp.]
MIEKNCTVFPSYTADEKKKAKLHYISFKLLCLSLYIIGFYYVFLNISLENKSLDIAKNFNICKRNLGEAEKNNKGSKRKKNLNNKKEDINKTKHNTHNIKWNDQKVEENKSSANNDLDNSKVENKSNISISNINYNDMSKNLTEKQLLDVLNSLEECPSKEDVLNLWRHTLGVNRERLNASLNELFNVFPKNSIDFSFIPNKEGNTLSYTTIWNKCVSEFGTETSINETRFTKEFYELINNKSSIDDIRNFIFSCLDEFEQKYKELYKECEANVISFKKKG